MCALKWGVCVCVCVCVCDFQCAGFSKITVTHHSLVHIQYSICLAHRFSRNTVTQQCHVEILLTKFHSYWSRNTEKMGRNSLPTWSETWLSASWFQRSSLWVYFFFWQITPTPNFMKTRGALCCLKLGLHHFVRNVQTGITAPCVRSATRHFVIVWMQEAPQAAELGTSKLLCTHLHVSNCLCDLPRNLLPAACPPVFRHFQGPHYPRVMYIYCSPPPSLLPPSMCKES